MTFNVTNSPTVKLFVLNLRIEFTSETTPGIT